MLLNTVFCQIQGDIRPTTTHLSKAERNPDRLWFPAGPWDRHSERSSPFAKRPREAAPSRSPPSFPPMVGGMLWEEGAF